MNDQQPVYRFTNAIVRAPSRSVVDGLRAHDGPGPDFDGVAAEHAAYVAALGEAGVSVTVLPAAEAFPDSVFVEDPALVFAQGAIVLRPGTASRAGEAALIEPVLASMFEQVLPLSGGHAEGGDILTTANKVMIGLSARTDAEGAKALVAALARLGRNGEIVETPKGVLHFKTECSLLDEEMVLATSRMAASGVFRGFNVVTVPEGEEAAANALRVNDVVLLGDGFPQTEEMLSELGFKVVALSTRQIGLIDAGLSCMSLRW